MIGIAPSLTKTLTRHTSTSFRPVAASTTTSAPSAKCCTDFMKGDRRVLPPQPRFDKRCIPIGNPDIIGKRTNKTVVVIPPGGVLGEYVPFYFSGHSPMLFNIVTGYGVEKVPQKDIVFLVCDALKIVNAGIPYCFTDGNATKAISKFYNDCMGCVNWIGLAFERHIGRIPRMIMTGSVKRCLNS